MTCTSKLSIFPKSVLETSLTVRRLRALIILCGKLNSVIATPLQLIDAAFPQTVIATNSRLFTSTSHPNYPNIMKALRLGEVQVKNLITLTSLHASLHSWSNTSKSFQNQRALFIQFPLPMCETRLDPKPHAR